MPPPLTLRLKSFPAPTTVMFESSEPSTEIPAAESKVRDPTESISIPPAESKSNPVEPL